jgi:hypothetical protein
MTMRVAAIGVSHWDTLRDGAYLRHLVAMPDVRLAARAGRLIDQAYALAGQSRGDARERSA